MSTSLHGVLVFFLLLSSKALVLADTTACPDNNCGTAIQNQLTNLMTVILAMNSTLKEQAKDLQDTKTNCIYGAELGRRDCSDIRRMGFTTSGVYRVYPGSDDRRVEAYVYCNLNSSTSWLVFQRRMDGSVNFERGYSDYERGFGNLTGEFWLGNEKLSLLTMNGRYKLLIELEDFAGEKRYAEYSSFSVAPATDNYRLTVGGYSGDAGDGMALHNGMQFTTSDADNDPWTGNCAVTFHGAWWYNGCHDSNLNGLYLSGSHTSYADGIEWNPWHGQYYSLKATEMKIAAY